MSARTGIEWTDATWNPVVGCERVSPGCAHCYAKKIHDQRHEAYLAGKPVAPQYAHPFGAIQLKPERLADPLGWRTPRRVFVNSVSDLFHEAIPEEFIAAVFGVMQYAPRHTFQILTKRPERMRAVVSRLTWGEAHHQANRIFAGRPLVPGRMSWERAWKGEVTWPLPNVWLGVSVENQHFADRRIPLLLATPAAVRFLSCEPLLGAVDLTRIGRFRDEALSALEEVVGFVERPAIDWVIVGGESGARARPMHPGWARHLRDQCVAAGVPFFFKQWGEYLPGRTLDDGRDEFDRVGKKRAGRELDGRTWDEMPGKATSPTGLMSQPDGARSQAPSSDTRPELAGFRGRP